MSRLCYSLAFIALILVNVYAQELEDPHQQEINRERRSPLVKSAAAGAAMGVGAGHFISKAKGGHRVARSPEPLVKSAAAGAAVGVGAGHFISKGKKGHRVARSPRPLVKSALAGAAIGVGAGHFISKARKG